MCGTCTVQQLHAYPGRSRPPRDLLLGCKGFCVVVARKCYFGNLLVCSSHLMDVHRCGSCGLVFADASQSMLGMDVNQGHRPRRCPHQQSSERVWAAVRERWPGVLLGRPGSLGWASTHISVRWPHCRGARGKVKCSVQPDHVE